jgi:hypothetical protein
MFRMPRIGSALVVVWLIGAAMAPRASAQETNAWRWRLHGNIFAGANYQYREFRDFGVLESQNWFMGQGERPLGNGRLTVTSMVSLERFTLRKIGSPQVFQSGETFEGAPLVDYQHPHDLVSALTIAYVRPVAAWTLTAQAAPVGSPALGPPPFMHRPTASENPQSPLSHHNLDSVHITPGVLSLGVSRGTLGVDTSWFRGREPDERRTDIDFGALDSWSIRGTWRRGGWSAQLSGARVNEPEISKPGDLTRLMASVSHARSGTISTSLFAAWGQNREAAHTKDAYIFESLVVWLERNYLYSRAELVAKDILHVGSHGTAAAPDAHPLSRVGAFTLGYTRDLNGGIRGRLGLGGDATMYFVPHALQENYGGPLSFHLFLRFRFGVPAQGGMPEHHH